MIVLDTNVISSQMVRTRDFIVLEWLNQFEPDDLYLTSITIAELYFGALIVPEANRREALLRAITRLTEAYKNRIYSFSESSSQKYGQVTSSRRLSGRPIETKDAMIASICLINNAALATRNTWDFEGLDLKLINPFEA